MTTDLSQLTDNQLAAKLLEIAIQEVALNQTKTSLATELITRQIKSQQTNNVNESAISLPKLKKVQIPTQSPV